MKTWIARLFAVASLAAAAATLASCVKEDEFDNTPEGNFELLWKIIDEHYCFFEYKDIDWNLVVPRLEKGYTNEKQYSKLDYYFSGEKKPEQLGRGGRNGSESIVSKVKWFAFQQL